MFAACILFALPTIKETWVRADTHPVYNSRIYPLGMGGLQRFGSYPANLEYLKFEVVRDCARYRNVLENVDALLKTEFAKANPDASTIEMLTKMRDRYQKSLDGHAEILKIYPELDKRIEDERLKLKQKKE